MTVFHVIIQGLQHGIVRLCITEVFLPLDKKGPVKIHFTLQLSSSSHRSDLSNKFEVKIRRKIRELGSSISQKTCTALNAQCPKIGKSTITHFLQFQKWQKINFCTRKKSANCIFGSFKLFCWCKK